MFNKIRILLISPYLPSIDTGACANKIYESIRLLYERGHSIHLISFCSEDDKKRTGTVRPYCASLHLEYIKDYFRFPRKSPDITYTIDSLCKNRIVNILQCENSYLTRYIPAKLNIPSLLVEHEVLSVSFFERFKLERRLRPKLIFYMRAVKKYIEERKYYPRFDKLIVFSSEDKNTTYRLYNLKHAQIIPLGIDLRGHIAQEEKDRQYDLIFVGNFSHAPNADAIIYFCKIILPLVKERLPDISLIIVGRNAPPEIEALAESKKNINFAENVKDVSGYYYKSKIFIAPIRYGTGMRYKILEAMAFNMPIIATSVASRGMLSLNNIIIADTPKEFADAVVELIEYPDKCAHFASGGRETLEKHYSWDNLLNKYEDIYYDLLKRA